MPVVDPRLADKPMPKISREAMERSHVARAAKARGADIAFVDQRIPAYEREIINMVGMGVTENPELAPHVKAGAAGFSVTYVRAPQGCGAALHRHATEEVFIPVKGRWQVFWLDGDAEQTVDLDEGDVCNVPIGIYRGFRNLSGAFFVSAGVLFYLYLAGSPAPVVGAYLAVTPTVNGVRAAVHAVLFIVFFYLGYIRK